VSEEQLVGDAAALVVELGDAAVAIGAARMRSRPAARGTLSFRRRSARYLQAPGDRHPHRAEDELHISRGG
jgi:hypothetical protein